MINQAAFCWFDNDARKIVDKCLEDILECDDFNIDILCSDHLTASGHKRNRREGNVLTIIRHFASDKDTGKLFLKRLNKGIKRYFSKTVKGEFAHMPEQRRRTFKDEARQVSYNILNSYVVDKGSKYSEKDEFCRYTYVCKLVKAWKDLARSAGNKI